MIKARPGNARRKNNLLFERVCREILGVIFSAGTTEQRLTRLQRFVDGSAAGGLFLKYVRAEFGYLSGNIHLYDLSTGIYVHGTRLADLNYDLVPLTMLADRRILDDRKRLRQIREYYKRVDTPTTGRLWCDVIANREFRARTREDLARKYILIRRGEIWYSQLLWLLKEFVKDMPPERRQRVLAFPQAEKRLVKALRSHLAFVFGSTKEQILIRDFRRWFYHIRPDLERSDKKNQKTPSIWSISKPRVFDSDHVLCEAGKVLLSLPDIAEVDRQLRIVPEIEALLGTPNLLILPNGVLPGADGAPRYQCLITLLLSDIESVPKSEDRITVIFYLLGLPYLFQYFHERILELERANLTTLRQVAIGLAHDFRTPLGTFELDLMELRMLLSDSTSALQLVSDLERKVFLMGQVLGNLDDFSRGIDLKSAVEAASCPTSVREILEDARSLVKLDDDIELECQAPPNLILRCDRQRLLRCVYNLILNAGEAFPVGKGRIQVGAEQRGDHVTIWVEDNGVGISPEIINQVWNFGFSSVTGGKSAKPKGSGIGLAVVKQIAEAHGGTADIKSTIGRGTRVSLHLPLQRIL